jgi:hypothetical protein
LSGDTVGLPGVTSARVTRDLAKGDLLLTNGKPAAILLGIEVREKMSRRLPEED